MSNPYQKMKIVKLFASDDYKTRNKAYNVIVKLLKFEFGDGKRQLNEKDLTAIWKGLYMWLWMQDKPILHEEVIGKICKLLNEIGHEKIALEFITIFFKTMLREWRKIDIHRIDKFYMLTRDFLGSSLKWLLTHSHEDESLAQSFLSALETVVLNSAIDQGIEFKMHLIDILLDELIQAEAPVPITTAIVMSCIRSIVFMSQKHVYVVHVKKRVIDRLIPLYKESKLQIDLSTIGSTVLEMALNEKMFAKAKNMCYHLSKIFTRCNKHTSAVPTADAPAVSMETKEEDDDDMEAESKETEEVGADAVVLADTTMEVDNVVSSSVDETESVVEATVPLTKKAANKKNLAMLSKNKSVAKKIVAVPATNGSVATVDRKVTFGKKYTKKFKKTDVNVAMSIGTVKNDQVKSILKKT